MVKRGEVVGLRSLWLEGHGVPEGSEVLGRSSRVRRAAPSLRTQPDELLVASYGATKTGHFDRAALPLTWSPCPSLSTRTDAGAPQWWIMRSGALSGTCCRT